jgi:hypothetical protein
MGLALALASPSYHGFWAVRATPFGMGSEDEEAAASRRVPTSRTRRSGEGEEGETF